MWSHHEHHTLIPNPYARTHRTVKSYTIQNRYDWVHPVLTVLRLCAIVCRGVHWMPVEYRRIATLSRPVNWIHSQLFNIETTISFVLPANHRKFIETGEPIRILYNCNMIWIFHPENQVHHWWLSHQCITMVRIPPFLQELRNYNAYALEVYVFYTLNITQQHSPHSCNQAQHNSH